MNLSWRKYIDSELQLSNINNSAMEGKTDERSGRDLQSFQYKITIK